MTSKLDSQVQESDNTEGKINFIVDPIYLKIKHALWLIIVDAGIL